MKRSGVVLILGMLLCSSLIVMWSWSQQPKIRGLLHADGTKILNVANEEVIWNGITCRGLFGYWHYGCEPTYPNADHVRIVREHGLNIIRIDFSLDMAVYGQEPGTPTSINYRPEFWALLDQIVDAGEKYGIWIEFNFSPVNWATLWNGAGFPPWMYDGTWEYGTYYDATPTGMAWAIREFFNTDNPDQDGIRQTYVTFWRDIAARYRTRSYIVFCLFNEPLNTGGTGDLIDFWPEGETTVHHFAEMFRDFVEHTIDEIRNVDAGLHMIIVQEMYLWYLGQNLQVRRPNIAIENHLYHDDFDILKQQEYANTAWRFNQPFFFGEMGGIPDLTSLAGTERFIQNCYNLRKPDGTSQRVGWMYLWYNPDAYSAGGISPTPEVWTMLENNLYPDIKYPDAYSP